jgi:hypothetical protein
MPDTIETQFARLDERLKALDAKGDEHHQPYPDKLMRKIFLILIFLLSLLLAFLLGLKVKRPEQNYSSDFKGCIVMDSTHIMVCSDGLILKPVK